MTNDQKHDRWERIGIMVYEGGATREEAERYCDSKPWIYGYRDAKETQKQLFEKESK